MLLVIIIIIIKIVFKQQATLYFAFDEVHIVHQLLIHTCVILLMFFNDTDASCKNVGIL